MAASFSQIKNICAQSFCLFVLTINRMLASTVFKKTKGTGSAYNKALKTTPFGRSDAFTRGGFAIMPHANAPLSLMLCFSGEQVYLGDWDKAIVRSLLTSSLLLPAIFLIGADNLQSSEIPGLIATFSLYIGVFLLVSIAGWLIIGFPVHWLACKYKKTNYLFYMVLPVTFSLVSGTTNGPWILGVIASVQALIFRYVVFKNKT